MAEYVHENGNEGLKIGRPMSEWTVKQVTGTKCSHRTFSQRFVCMDVIARVVSSCVGRPLPK